MTATRAFPLRRGADITPFVIFSLPRSVELKQHVLRRLQDISAEGASNNNLDGSIIFLRLWLALDVLLRFRSDKGQYVKKAYFFRTET